MLKKIKNVIAEQLTKGITPEKIAQSITVGLLIGIFPTLGATTLLSFIAGHFLKLNHIIVQTVNYLMYPVQIIMVPVYIKGVAALMDIKNIEIRPDLLIEQFNRDWQGFLKAYGLIGLYSIVVWAIGSVLLYYVLNAFFLKIVLKMNLKKN